MGFVNKFTVIQRKSKPTEENVVTERKVIGKPTFRKSRKDLRTYDEKTKQFKRESKVRDIVSKQDGISTEFVEGATFKWEITFNGEKHTLKEVITRKELQELFVKTNELEGDAGNLETNIEAMAEPTSSTTSVEVELDGDILQPLFVETQENAIFASGIHSPNSGPGNGLTGEPYNNWNVSPANPTSSGGPAPTPSDDDADECF